MISEAYGWTWPQIRKLTLRQIYIALENIIVSKENYYSFLGAVNGMQLKLGKQIGQQKETVKFSKESDALAEKHLKEALQRKLKEKGANLGK